MSGGIKNSNTIEEVVNLVYDMNAPLRSRGGHKRKVDKDTFLSVIREMKKLTNPLRAITLLNMINYDLR